MTINARITLQVAASLICERCASGRDPVNLPRWGWVHGTLGVGLFPCRAWKLHQAAAG